MKHSLGSVLRRTPGVLMAAAGVTLIAAGLLPWAHHGPGIHLMIGFCVPFSDCSRGLPGPPQYLLILLGLGLVAAGVRVIREVEAGGWLLAFGVVSLVLLGIDVWSIQAGFRALDMEVRDVAFFLAPAGVGLLALGIVAMAIRRRAYPVAAVLLLLLMFGLFVDSNMFRPAIYHCPGRSVGSGAFIC